MTGSFKEVFTSSLMWSKTVLFRPFSLKKWIFLWFIAAMALELQNGFNASDLNFDIDGLQPAAQQVGALQAEYTGEEALNKATEGYNSFMKSRGRALTAFLVVSIAAVVAVIFFIILWLYSVFAFVFIDSMVNDDASVRKPFVKNKALGSSYFKWNVAFGAAVVILFMLYALAFKNSMQAALSVPLLLGFSVVPLVIFSILFGVFVQDYVVVVMYKDRLPITKAFPKAYGLYRSEKGIFIKYFFIKVLIMLATGIMSAVASLGILLALLIPGAIIGLVTVGLYNVIPAGVQGFYSNQ